MPGVNSKVLCDGEDDGKYFMIPINTETLQNPTRFKLVICQHFTQGVCPMSDDECPFSHGAPITEAASMMNKFPEPERSKFMPKDSQTAKTLENLKKYLVDEEGKEILVPVPSFPYLEGADNIHMTMFYDEDGEPFLVPNEFIQQYCKSFLELNGLEKDDVGDKASAMPETELNPNATEFLPGDMTASSPSELAQSNVPTPTPLMMSKPPILSITRLESSGKLKENKRNRQQRNHSESSEPEAQTQTNLFSPDSFPEMDNNGKDEQPTKAFSKVERIFPSPILPFSYSSVAAAVAKTSKTNNNGQGNKENKEGNIDERFGQQREKYWAASVSGSDFKPRKG